MDSINLLSAGLEIFAAVVMAAVLYSCLSDTNSFSKRDRYIVLMIECSIVMLLADVPIYFLEGNVKYKSFLHLLAFISYLACEFEAVFFTYYLSAYLAKYVKVPRPITRTAVCLGAAGAVIWVIALFTGFFYTIDDNGFFVYGSHYWLAVVPTLFVIVMNISYTMWHAKKLSYRTLVLTAVYNIVPIVGCAFTKFWGNALVYILTMLVILLMYLMMHQDENLKSAEQSRQIMRQRAELANSRARIMMSQIQPHFLYNTLNAIYFLIEKDPATAQKAVTDFSDYLRMNIDSLSTAQPVEFDKELKHIETYLWIEKMRFDDELNVEYDIRFRDFLVPALAIQPFVENAVKHGICKKDGGGTLSFRTYKTVSGCVIEIEDDGVGFDTSIVPDDDGRTHVGVANSRHRLETMIGAEVVIESTIGVGTKVSIIIPNENDDEDNVPGKVILCE